MKKLRKEIEALGFEVWFGDIMIHTNFKIPDGVNYSPSAELTTGKYVLFNFEKIKSIDDVMKMIFEIGQEIGKLLLKSNFKKLFED